MLIYLIGVYVVTIICIHLHYKYYLLLLWFVWFLCLVSVIDTSFVFFSSLTYRFGLGYLRVNSIVLLSCIFWYNATISVSSKPFKVSFIPIANFCNCSLNYPYTKTKVSIPILADTIQCTFHLQHTRIGSIVLHVRVLQLIPRIYYSYISVGR